MPVPNLPKVIDVAYIADTLTLEAEVLRGLLRTGCLTPVEAGKLAEDLGRFCLEAAAVVKREAAVSEPETSRSRYDEASGRLPAEALFWD